MINCHTLVKMMIINKIENRMAIEDMEKLPCSCYQGNVKWYYNYGNQHGICTKNEKQNN